MAQWFVDPAEGPSVLDRFTGRYGDLAAPFEHVDDNGTPAIRWDGPFSSTFYSFDEAGTSIDFELVIKSRSDSTGNNQKGGCGGRFSDSAFTGYVSSPVGDGSVISEKVVAGSRTILTIAAPDNHSAITYNWLRLRVTGDRIQSRIWEATDPEPSVWHTDDIDGEITAAGWVGLFSRTNDSVFIARFGVGTDGDPAPMAPVGGGTAFAGDLQRGSIALGGSQYDVSAGADLPPAVGSLALSGTAASVSAGARMDTTAGPLAIGGAPGDVSAGAAPEALRGSLSAAGAAIDLTAGARSEIQAGALSIAGLELAVVTGDSIPVSVDIQPGSLVTSGRQHAVAAGYAEPLDRGQLSLAGLAGVISAGASMSVTRGALSFTARDAEFDGGISIDVSPGSIALSGQSIYTRFGQSLELGAGQLVFVGQQAGILTIEITTPDGRTLRVPAAANTIRVGARQNILTIN